MTSEKDIVKPRPEGCGRLRNLKVAVAGLSVLYMVEGLYGQYLSATITTLERRFQFSSTETGLIMQCNNITIIVSIILITYLGTRVNKAWGIGVCAALYSVAMFLMALPYFIYPDVDVRETSPVIHVNNVSTQSSADVSDPRCTSVRNESCGEREVVVANYNNNALIIFCVAQVIFGIVFFLPYSLGMPYIEENTDQHTASLYIGIMMGSFSVSSILGYLLGAAMTAIPEGLKDTGLTPADPQWVGAWWLGWIIAVVITFPWTIIFMQLPRKFDQSPVSKEDSVTTQEETDNKKEGTISCYHFVKNFFRIMWDFMKNPVYLVTILAITIASMGEGGRGFDPKYKETMFNMPASTINLLSVLEKIPNVIGSYLGGIIVARMRLSVRQTLLVPLVLYLVVAALDLVQTFLYCPAPHYHGTTLPNQLIPIDDCNKNCSCLENSYAPVCSAGVTFLSPCHMGCKEATFDSDSGLYNLSSCACTPVKTAYRGVCESGCQMVWAYVAVGLLSEFVNSLALTPYMLLVIRTAKKPEDKGMAFAFGATIYVILGSIAGPLLYGIGIDWSCIWKVVSCGEGGACRVYNLDYFRYLLHLPHVAGYVLSSLGYFLAYMLAKGSIFEKVDGNDDKGEATVQESNDYNNTRM